MNPQHMKRNATSDHTHRPKAGLRMIALRDCVPWDLLPTEFYESLERRSRESRTAAMIITTFRSRHSALAGKDYEDFFAELRELAKLNPGFIDIKTYQAEDGERLTIARWSDKETLQLWSQNLRHLQAKRLAGERWYDHFEIQTAEVFRTASFDRQAIEESATHKAFREARETAVPVERYRASRR